MKITHLILAATIACTATVAQAAEDRLDRVVNLLQRAKEAPKPLPILEDAKQKLADYTPNPEALGRGKRKQALQRDAQDDKRHAVERVNDAIKVARAGGDAKPKITAAIATVHALDSTTR
jgi:LPS O-antigen subunit length determinant protein (WzzB/FepE family)